MVQAVQSLPLRSKTGVSSFSPGSHLLAVFLSSALFRIPERAFAISLPQREYSTTPRWLQLSLQIRKTFSAHVYFSVHALEDEHIYEPGAETKNLRQRFRGIK